MVGSRCITFSVRYLPTKMILEGTIPRKYTGHIGAMIPIYEKRSGREIMQLSPGLVAISQQIVHQINYGLDLIYKNFFGGVWTRHDLLA